MDLEVLNLKADASSVDKATASVEDLEKKLSRTERAVAKAEEALKILRGELVQVGNRAISLGDGFTKSQANMLAMLKQAGATTTELKAMAKTMEQLNKITSTNPFDKSVQALNYVKKQREELTKSIKYAERYNDLTKEQISLMTRGIESVRQRAMSEQKNFGEREAAVKKFIKEFVKEAQSYNQVTAAIEEKNRVAKEELRIQQEIARAAQVSAKQRSDAEKYVQETLQRTLFINEQLEKGMSVSGANSLYAYKQQLDVLGLSADQAAAKMQQFQNALMQKQTLQGNRSPFKQMSEDVRQVGTEVNQLARAVSVQMGDVFVSLAGGMNPLLVAIQQGDQVRFALEQAAAAGQSMDKVMQGAFKSMANSFILVGKIVSDFLIDGFKALGSVFNGLLNTMPVFGNMITGWEMGFKRTAAQGDLLSKIIIGMAGAANIAIGAMVALGAFIGGVYLNALIKADQQQSQLAKSLGQYGASLGVAIDEARAFAVASEESTGTVVDAIGAIAKAGGFTAEQMKIVAVSAAEMNRVFGTSIDDIVSKYKDLQKDPVKALLELQARTGDVNETLIIKIRKMQEEGREYAAIGAAMEEYAAANKRTTDRTVENLGVIATVLSKISEGWRLLYKEIESLAASPTALENLLKAGKEVEELRKAAGSETDKIRQEVLKRELAIAEQNLEVVKKTWVEENKANELRRQRSELAELELKHTDTIKNAKPEQIKFAEKQLELQNDYNRALQNGASPEFLAGLSSAMQKNAKDYEEYLKRANKPPEGAKALENYFERISEKVSDLKIKVTDEYNSMTQGTSKMISAQKLLLDILNDDKWSKLTKSQQEKVKADIEEVAAIEKKVQLIKEELALTELLAEFSKVSEENKATIQEETDALQLRNDLLFKTEEEAKAIQRQYDLNLKLVQIENKYIAQRNDLIANYVKMVKEGTLNAANMDAYNKAMIELVRQEAQERQLAHQDANMKIVEDYAAKFKEVQGTVTDIIATAMFEGGKAGSKKLKDVLKAEFRKYVIRVFIEPVVGQVMGSVFGASGGSFGGGGTGGSTGGIFGLPGGGDIGSNVVSFLDESAMSAIGSGYTSLGEGLSSLSGTINSANTYLKSIPGFEGGVSSALGYVNAIGTAMDGNYGKALGQAVGTYFGGPIGAAVGGAIGDALGWTKKPSDKTSWAVIDPTTGRLGEVGDMGGKKAASEEQKTANTQLSQLIGGFAGLAGITGQIVTAMGSRDGVRLALSSGLSTPMGQGVGGNWFGSQQAYAYGSDPADAAVKMMEDLLDEGTLSQAVIDSWNALKTTTEGVTKDAVELISNINLLVSGYDEQSIKRADLLQLENESLEVAYARMLQYEKALSGTALPGDSLAETIKSLYASFTRLNVEVPMSNAEMNNLISSLDLTTEGGKAAYTSLMGLIPSFLEVTAAHKTLYEQFYSEEELLTIRISEMSEVFNQLGFNLPQTIGDFKSLVDAQDMLSSSGIETRAQLLSLLPAYKELHDAYYAQEEVVSDVVETIEEAYSRLKNVQMTPEDIARERISLEERLFEATATQSEIANYARNKINEYNRGLYDQVLLAEAAKKALEDKARAEEQALADAKSSVDEIFSAFSERAQASIQLLEKSFEATDSALSAVENAITARKDEIQKSIDSANKTLDILKDVFVLLSDSIKSLRGDVLSTKSAGYSQARSFISSSTVSSIKANPSAFTEAVDVAVSGISGIQFATKTERDKQYLLLSNELEKLSSSVKPQMDAAERVIVGLERQLLILDSQLENAKELVDSVRGVDNTTLSVNESIKKLETAVDAERVAREQISKIQYQISVAETQMNSLKGIDRSTQTLSQLQASFNTMFSQYLAMLSASSSGETPQFATGGVFTNSVISKPTLFNMGEMGEAGSEAIIPLTNIGGSLGVNAVMPNMDAVVDELQALRGETTMLRAEVRAVASNTSKSAKLLDRAMPDGQSLLVTTA